jgi:hypothetical protein
VSTRRLPDRRRDVVLRLFNLAQLFGGIPPRWWGLDLLESLLRSYQRARGECYLRGLMLEGRRKSVEPMAARLGEVHYQALHHFVAASAREWRTVRRRLAERLVGALEPTVWAGTTSAFPRDGQHSVGVQRQYSGTLGITANCQLGVSVNAVTEQASCPSDWRWFLPHSWIAISSGARPVTCPSGCGAGRTGTGCWTWSTGPGLGLGAGPLSADAVPTLIGRPSAHPPTRRVQPPPRPLTWPARHRFTMVSRAASGPGRWFAVA